MSSRFKTPSPSSSKAAAKARISGVSNAVKDPKGTSVSFSSMILNYLLIIGIFSLTYRVITYTNMIPDLPNLSFGEGFLLGGFILNAATFLYKGDWLLTPFWTMIFMGAVHHEVFEAVPPLGFWPLFFVYALCSLLRWTVADLIDFTGEAKLETNEDEPDRIVLTKEK